eukprot:6209158-Pleurochrysis_carterae.AAC.4
MAILSRSRIRCDAGWHSSHDSIHNLDATDVYRRSRLHVSSISMCRCTALLLLGGSHADFRRCYVRWPLIVPHCNRIDGAGPEICARGSENVERWAAGKHTFSRRAKLVMPTHRIRQELAADPEEAVAGIYRRLGLASDKARTHTKAAHARTLREARANRA